MSTERPDYITVFCPSCGKKIAEERFGIKKRRCPECGHEFSEVEIKARERKGKKKRS